MIIEQAQFEIKPGSEEEFERAVEQAKSVIAQAAGFRSLKLSRGIDDPSSFLMINEWDTLEDHMVGFRESELFPQWRALIGPYFATPPEVAHFEAPTVCG